MLSSNYLVQQIVNFCMDFTSIPNASYILDAAHMCNNPRVCTAFRMYALHNARPRFRYAGLSLQLRMFIVSLG